MNFAGNGNVYISNNRYIIVIMNTDYRTKAFPFELQIQCGDMVQENEF